MEEINVISELKKEIVLVAKKYLGVKEIPGNMGFYDKVFAVKAKRAGFQNGYAWCMITVEVVVVEAIENLEKRLNKDLSALKKDTESEITPSTVGTWNNFKESVFWQRFTENPQVGDIVIFVNTKNRALGHAGVITGVLANGYFKSVEGNAQPLWSKVLTPSGYKEMGTLRVGDEILNPDGSIQNIKAIYPQGELPIYKVTMSDGSSCYASDNHLWSAFRSNVEKPYLLDTLSLKEKVESQKEKTKYRLPGIDQLNMHSKEGLIIDPYFLGCLIGDGGLTGKDVRFTTKDPEILDTIVSTNNYIKPVKYGQYDYQLTCPEYTNNPVANEVKRLGINTKSISKFIPEKYLNTTFENRLALLQGLLDTDGHCDIYGRIEYSTSSEKLITDVIWLIRSLGGRCKKQTKTRVLYTSPTQITKKEAHTSYRVAVILPSNITPFKLSRHLERYKNRVSKALIEKTVQSVEFVGYDICQCIKVSNENQLYITDDFIVTHNTNSDGSREGNIVAGKTRVSKDKDNKGLDILGFVRLKDVPI